MKRCATVLCFLCALSLAACPPSSSNSAGYPLPEWGATANVVEFAYDTASSMADNGRRLAALLEGGVAPGTRVLIGAGEYELNERFHLALPGSEAAPIVIEAQGEVIIRNTPNQNVLELGGTYVILRALTFTGGSSGIRLQDGAHHIWIDQCRIHHVDNAALTANNPGATYHHLYITGNEFSHTGGHGEGMYLGGNNATAIVHTSWIIGNHVHDTLNADQGDGIELKQGSWGNVIAENLIHDTKYPAITVYGTGGKAQNIIERNVCLRAEDNTMQVQGEAIVRENICISAGGVAFRSGDHQGQTRDLTVERNSFLNTGRAVRLADWDGRPGMAFNRNMCYSRDDDAIWTDGTLQFNDNVYFGTQRGVSGDFSEGGGLDDFADATWDGARWDVTPVGDFAGVAAGAPPETVTAIRNRFP